MKIFVDYENLPDDLKRRGLVGIADRLVTVLGPDRIIDQQADMRLYGGWYEINSLTPRAQTLMAETGSEFPRPLKLKGKRGTVPIRLKAELAFSLSNSPAKHLFHTYRSRGSPIGLKCRNSQEVGCTKLNCPMDMLASVVNQKKCPTAGCTLVMDDALYRGEQKLVDTMLVSDLLWEAHQATQELCIVSSDDDFWPGVLTTMALGSRIIHITTKSTPQQFYLKLAGTGYEMLAI